MTVLRAQMWFCLFTLEWNKERIRQNMFAGYKTPGATDRLLMWSNKEQRSKFFWLTARYCQEVAERSGHSLSMHVRMYLEAEKDTLFPRKSKTDGEYQQFVQEEGGRLQYRSSASEYSIWTCRNKQCCMQIKNSKKSVSCFWLYS